MHKTWQDIGREWLDTLVVAISVAMAFRAYFYEPFNIPTGSMRPTLYGNHYRECAEPSFMDKTPGLKWLKWLGSGYDYKELIAPEDGYVYALPRNDGRSDLQFRRSATTPVVKRICVPTDAMAAVNAKFESIGGHVARARVSRGQKVFSGYDVTGDFIFVNRWLWNFRRPVRGDVMVFGTTGIPQIQQGTHYIKRMTALPGETIEIKDGAVHIDGKQLDPIKPMVGARGEAAPTPIPAVGVADAALTAGESFTLGEGEYFACGDNSANSLDSRYWGAVPKRNLCGVGSCVFWPIINPRWGAIK